MAAAIHLYLDENISPKVAVQLRRRGFNATSIHEMGLTGDEEMSIGAWVTKLELLCSVLGLDDMRNHIEYV